MSEINPCKKAVEITEEIMKMCEVRGLSYEEITDVPDELRRKIKKSISDLKRTTSFTRPR